MIKKPFLLIQILAITISSEGREADDRSKFLYVNNPAAKGIIWDYEPHMHAPHFVIEDRSDKHKEFADKISETNSTEEDVRPFFLRDEYPIPRVVQLYSPWCGHCQAFAPQYIKTATSILGQLPKFHLEFYAISCSEHHQLCLREEVHGYPTLRAYPAYSDEYIALEKFTQDAIDDALELELKEHSEAASDLGTKQTKPEAEQEQSTQLDILGATKDGYRHTRTDVYRDAALSFTYALENHIFEEDQTELTPEQVKALAEWLDLLYWTLPPTWMVHALINDLRRNFKSIVDSKSNLQNLVNLHRPVVHNRKDMQWSQGCRNGEGVVASFSCGLWCLFHIVSVGVPERHGAVLGHRHRVSTYHAAETIKDYIQQFFSWCPQCREQYLQLYKSCAYNHCRRFRQKTGRKGKEPPAHTWVEFPLWIWQIHNEINEKLMTKEAHKLHRRKPTQRELERARWPPEGACHNCFAANGKWDKQVIYSYLKEEYWPTGVHNFRYVVLDRKEQSEQRKYLEPLERIRDFFEFLIFLVPAGTYEIAAALTAILLMVGSYSGLRAARRQIKKERIKKTGRHKKYDIQPIFDVDA